MSKTLNFNNVKKQYLTVVLNDKDNTALMIGTPTKKILDELILLQDSLTEIHDDNVGIEEMDNLFSSCAKIMSRNKGGILITKEKLEDIFDFEDITMFFNAYMSFIDEVMKTKN